jgi:uracil-DNA glycosylase family 4
VSEFVNLKEKCLDCRKCRIGGQVVPGTNCVSNVFSNGNKNAKIMVVGQNPGMDEVIQGQPFVGRSGQVFDEAVARITGLTRNNLYITNVIKCWTIGNRKPVPEEVENCQEFLDAEFAIVKPTVVIALGSFALKATTGMSGISKHCGQVVFSPRYRVPVIPMLHPSPFNTNHPVRKDVFEQGFHRLASFLAEGGSIG